MPRKPATGAKPAPAHDILLQPYKLPHRTTSPFNVQILLDEAERDYLAGDRLAALRAVYIAAEYDLPIPRRIAPYIAHAIAYYLHEHPKHGRTLDNAFGLKASGRASPRRALREDRQREALLSRMVHLQMAGATIRQASVLVARLTPDFKATYLANLYTRGGYGARARELVAALDGAPVDLEAMLAEYPDARDGKGDVAQAKAEIRRVYSKRQG